jgi:Uncharacterised methyltransferase family (DUF6094)
MSHVGNKIRAGFFATPKLQGEYIRKVLSFLGDCSVLDPTCGEGEVLYQITENQEPSITTYGVELDKQRASKANELLNHCINAPIESMVISNDSFGLLYLNPPYDFAIKGAEDDSADRKEFLELVRNTRYLQPGGVMVYVIPSYRFADAKIARFLATNFEQVGIMKFSEEDYDDFRQCIFIGHKKKSVFKEINQQLHDFLLQMESEEFIKERVTPINLLVGRHKWIVPTGAIEIKTFYTKLQLKSDFVDSIRNSKGFMAFKERSKPKSLVIGGNPIINIAQGNMALLLASGACNGLIGTEDNLHAVQGLEIVSKVKKEDKQTHDNGTSTTKTTIRTKREVSVKVITPSGLIKKFV